MNTVKFDRKKVFLFFIGLLSMTQIRLIGAFPLCEFITIPMGIFLSIRLPEYFSNRRFRNVIVLCLLWLFGAFVSDVYNQSEIIDMLKGLGTIIILLLNFVFSFWALKDNYYRIIWFLIGSFLSAFIQLFVFTSISLEEAMMNEGIQSIWEVWSVYFIAPVVLIIAFYFNRTKRKWVVIFILLYAIYSIFNMSRNQFLTYSLTSLLLLAIGNVNNYEDGMIKQRILQKKSMRYLLLIFIGLFVVKESYEYLASKQYLGEAAYRKYEIQKLESKLGLASGRKEFLIGLYAVKDSPIIGFGSFAQSDINYWLSFLTKYDSDNIAVINAKRYDTIIPAHSHIVCAWLWHGILGLIFWIYVVYIIFLLLWKYLLIDPSLIAFLLLMSFVFLWNIFFSPFVDRIGEAMRIVFIVISINHFDKLIFNNKRIKR